MKYNFYEVLYEILPEQPMLVGGFQALLMEWTSSWVFVSVLTLTLYRLLFINPKSRTLSIACPKTSIFLTTTNKMKSFIFYPIMTFPTNVSKVWQVILY